MFDSLDKSNQDAPDYSDLFRATKDLSSELAKLAAMSTDLAAASATVEFDADRRKNALSKAVLQAFKEGAKGVADAEHRARASTAYEETMKRLLVDYGRAEFVRAEAKLCIIKIESLRSIIAVHRQIAGIQ